MKAFNSVSWDFIMDILIANNTPTHFIRLRGSEHSDELRWELGLDHDLDLGHKELDQRNPLRNRKSQPHWLCPLLPFVGPSPAFAYGTTVATGGGTSCGFCLSSCLCLWSISLLSSQRRMVSINRSLFHLGQRAMPLYMLHRSMLLG